MSMTYLCKFIPLPFALSVLRNPMCKKLSLSLSGYGVPAKIVRLCGVKAGKPRPLDKELSKFI